MQPDQPKNAAPTFDEVLETSLSRRQFLRSAGAVGLTAWLATLLPGRALADHEHTTALTPATPPRALGFTEIPKRLSRNPAVAPGYSIQPVISWGEALHDQAQPFRVLKNTPDEQARRFGYNNDFLAYLPLPRGDTPAYDRHGLLCVNHEYTNLRLMFPGIEKRNERYLATETQGRIEQQAQGVSIVEVVRTEKDGWQPKAASRYNRRLTATTPIALSGPAAGAARMQTTADPQGRTVLGTFANCAGGVTPWGTALTCEENVDGYFSNLPDEHSDEPMWKRYTIGNEPFYNWHEFDARFDVSKEPNECNRFGWVVEYDPYDPESQPKKRTALGRFKHECATCALAPDGRVVIYSGDDQVFEYIYRFVSTRPYQPSDSAANRDLLDEGTLYVAKFEADGMLRWLPLVHGQGRLTPEHGFADQAEVMIYARRAADLLGATAMDRPEDVEVDAKQGHVYVSLTKNKERKADQRQPFNRRSPNPYGHIVRMIPPAANGQPDHAAERFAWDLFLEGGNPAEPKDKAMYIHTPSEHGWLTNPDNLATDRDGNLWICTDGQDDYGTSEGLYAAATDGPERGRTRLFFTAPIGAEVTGPCFTPDGRTLFLSVQHPGETPPDSEFEHPSTRWPNHDPEMPPRPTVIAITKDDGDLIGR